MSFFGVLFVCLMLCFCAPKGCLDVFYQLIFNIVNKEKLSKLDVGFLLIEWF